MHFYRDRTIRISDTSPDARDNRDSVVQHGAGATPEVYDSGGTRLSTYAPNPYDKRPVRQFNIQIEKLRRHATASQSSDSEANTPHTQ